MSRTIVLLLVVLALASGVSAHRKHPKYSFSGRPLWSSDWWKFHDESIPIYDESENTSVKMAAFPETLSDGEDVVISWAGVTNANASDYITLSCGPTNGLDDFLDYRAVPDASGSGSVRFPWLIMLRCNYVFNYMNNQGNQHVLLASIQVPMRDTINAPKQGHIAFADRFDQMWVSYVSASTNTATVKYGTQSGVYTSTATGTTTTYHASDMCHPPANTTSQTLFRSPGNLHHVLLSQLQPRTIYYYRYGNDQDGWSSESYFISRPDPSQVFNDTVRFIAYADMGSGPAPSAKSTSVRSEIEVANGYRDFLLHFGDIAYAIAGAYSWDQFMTLVEPYATKVPYMVSIGNHEYDHIIGGEHDPSNAGPAGWHPSWGNMGWDSGGECGVPVFYRFRSPSNGNSIFWYSFDYGNVHIIQMSSEHDWTQGSDQYNWIAKDLANVDRSKTPWVIITAHRMMYTTQLGENNDYIVSEHMKTEMEDLLYENKVNMMLVGHQHSYERTCPVYKKECQTDGSGTVHIVVGSAGAGLESDGFSNQFGNYSIAHVNDWGYCRMTPNSDVLHMEFVLNDSGSVYDEIFLYPWGDKRNVIPSVSH